MALAVLSLLGLALVLPIGHAMHSDEHDAALAPTQFEMSWQPFITAWDDYAASANEAALYGLQEGCKPRHVQHEGDYKGVAVLFHGFTACPDQWDQMARLLAEAGYEVLLPVHPGHGNNLPADRDEVVKGSCIKILNCVLPLDDTKNVPEDADKWEDFARMINDIVRLAPAKTIEGDEAKHAVAGISVGAVLATYAGTAALEEGGAKPLYAHQLIMNAFFAPHGLSKRFALDVVGRLRKNAWMGSGQNCLDERKHGRAGFCSYQLKKLGAVGDLGKTTLKNLQVTGSGENAPKIAVIYSKGDPIVENSRMRDLKEKYDDMGADVHSCVLPFTSHSMLSDHDFKGLGENRWWTTPVTCKAVRFLTQGVPFEISEESESTEGNEMLCDLEGDGTTFSPHVFIPDGNPQIPTITCGK